MRQTKSSLPRAVVVALVMIVGFINVEAQSQSREPEQHFQHARARVKTYVCPMHPEVKSAKPGKCPKCKMDLHLERTPISAPASDAGERTDSGSRSGMVIPDVEVLDQEGNSLHFYSDLIKGKTVAINFIFTNCTTICPPLAATFARLQKEMGERVGKDVHLISISVDPLTDTPERLKSWGAKFKAGPGWSFVTGNKQEMDKLLSALGASVSRREDHTPSVIIGNDVKGIWTRTYGLAKVSVMVGLIQDVIDGKVETKETVKL